MSDRTVRVEIRMTPEERDRWKRVEAQIDPVGAQADSLMKMIDVYEANPKLFTPDYR